MTAAGDPWEVLRDPRTIVFIGGHEVGCEDHDSCDCADRYEDIFNCCSNCGAELDDRGECSDWQECESWT